MSCSYALFAQAALHKYFRPAPIFIIFKLNWIWRIDWVCGFI